MSNMTFKEACTDVVKDIVSTMKTVTTAVFLKRFTFAVVGVLVILSLIATTTFTIVAVFGAINPNFWLLPVSYIVSGLSSFLSAVLSNMGWDK